MKINSRGLKLIRRFEGFRASAYRDAVGVWTIGYGHTSRAGPPHVGPGMKITRAQGEKILARDVEKFATQIRPLIRVPLNDNQFSALVSFAYNVGVGGFRRSSVLRVVNRGRFDLVPQRLSLWVKAGGRVLPGLVRRRAAEGVLFARPIGRQERTTTTAPVEPAPGKPPQKSTTNIATLMGALAGLISAVANGLKENASFLTTAILTLVIVACAAWIVRERYLKSANDGV